MKTQLVFLLAFFVLASCSPSENQIQTAIAQTEAAKPTLTSTEKLTYTPEPTLTPTTNIPLRQLAITKKDLNDTIPGYYNTELAEVDLGSNNNKDIIDQFGGVFVGENGAGNISLLFKKYASQSICINDTSAMKSLISGTDLSLPEITLPEGAYMIERKQNNDVVMVYCQSNIQVTIIFDLTQGLTGKDVSNVVAIIGQKQYFKLQDAGYR